jgi:hypothetical protein
VSYEVSNPFQAAWACDLSVGKLRSKSEVAKSEQINIFVVLIVSLKRWLVNFNQGGAS